MNERTGSGAGWFLFQRVSGLLLAVLLLFHFVLIHFSGADLNSAAVSARLAGNLYRVVDLVFLGLALAHGLYGAWMVAADYLQHPWLRVAVLVACAVAGMFLTILGALTILAG
jgi:succinate dehydrogenase / fumarate reductase, membrane anchor subunit